MYSDIIKHLFIHLLTLVLKFVRWHKPIGGKKFRPSEIQYSLFILNQRFSRLGGRGEDPPVKTSRLCSAHSHSSDYIAFIHTCSWVILFNVSFCSKICYTWQNIPNCYFSNIVCLFAIYFKTLSAKSLL